MVSRNSSYTPLKVYELQEDPSISFRPTKDKSIMFSILESAKSIAASYRAGSMKSSVSLIMASALGCGFIYIPFAMYIAGLYLGIIILLFTFLCTFFACYCLIQASIKTNRVSYYGLADYLFGGKYGSIVEMAVVIECYDCLLVYIVDIQEFFCDAFEMWGYEDTMLVEHALWGFIVTILVLYPISLYREISALRYTTIVSFVSAVFMLIVIVCECISLKYDDFGQRVADVLSERPMLHAASGLNIFMPISKLSWAFTCQPNVLSIYNELEYRDLSKGLKSVGYGLGIVGCLYLLMGFFGYILFHNEGLSTSFFKFSFYNTGLVAAVIFT
jgi:amino acid permease